MTKILSCAAVVGLLVASSSGVLARAGGGASSISPGQQFRSGGPQTVGPTAGYPGASGYAPVRLYLGNRTTHGSPGASIYAPGFLK
jgi:hypothetical protein